MLIVVEFKELSALRCFECLADGCFATARDLLDVRCVTRETAVAVPSGSYSVCIRPSGRIAARRLLVFSAGPFPPSPFLPRAL